MKKPEAVAEIWNSLADIIADVQFSTDEILMLNELVENAGEILPSVTLQRAADRPVGVNSSSALVTRFAKRVSQSHLSPQVKAVYGLRGSMKGYVYFETGTDTVVTEEMLARAAKRIEADAPQVTNVPSPSMMNMLAQLTLGTDERWQDYAACQYVPPETFKSRTPRSSESSQFAAYLICGRCEVRDTCLQDKMSGQDGEHEGLDRIGRQTAARAPVVGGVNQRQLDELYRMQTEFEESTILERAEEMRKNNFEDALLSYQTVGITL